MNILAVNKTLEYPIYLVHKLDTSELSEDLVFIADISNTNTSISCYRIRCDVCPLENMCVNNGTSPFKQSVVQEYFPDYKDKHPEYFI